MIGMNSNSATSRGRGGMCRSQCAGVLRTSSCYAPSWIARFAWRLRVPIGYVILADFPRVRDSTLTLPRPPQ